MTYEIGQKVETPLGVGEIVGVIEYPKGYGNTYRVDIKIKEEVINKMYEFDELKPYKTAHEKLIEMGLHFKITNDYAGDIFSHEWWNDNNYRVLAFYVNEKETTVSEANHDIMRIIPQYLEEMAE